MRRPCRARRKRWVAAIGIVVPIRARCQARGSVGGTVSKDPATDFATAEQALPTDEITSGRSSARAGTERGRLTRGPDVPSAGVALVLLVSRVAGRSAGCSGRRGPFPRQV